ncbi:MAG: S1C family serine protease [Clostridiales bacterium]|jgi:S1-C subfamily serine protease|nr:S1C family serine protease [Clostridiales bacterium]
MDNGKNRTQRKGYKGLSILLAVLVLVGAAFLTAGCSRGESAYEIAVRNGFIGTEVEWLNSLKAESAGLPIDVHALFELYREVHPEATADDFLEEFYSRIGYHTSETAATTALRSTVSLKASFSNGNGSAGSGVILRMDDAGTAYIMTNYHVIYSNGSALKNVKVYAFGREGDDGYGLTAAMIGGSMDLDIAVLRVDLSSINSGFYRAAALAGFDTATYGQSVLAVGNPEDSGLSVTSGIVSIVSEDITMKKLNGAGGSVQMRVMRSDAAINPGNSGGGLYDLEGRLMGIVNAKSAEEGTDNIGFAIPISVAAGIADNVIDGGGKKYKLGITTKSAQSYGNVDENGKAVIYESCKIVDVNASGLASGKLKTDDILVSAKLDNREKIQITRNYQLSDYLFYARRGGSIEIEVIRDGAPFTAAITFTGTGSAL